MSPITYEHPVTYLLRVLPEFTPVRGNAMHSGDPKVDREVEDEVLADLKNGNEWAWAHVIVEAIVEKGEHVFIGRAQLGCCSYKDEQEFRESEYFADLKKEALEDLKMELDVKIREGDAARELLEELKRNEK